MGVGGHRVETADVRTLVMRWDGLIVACQGMHYGRGYRGGMSMGVIHVIIPVTFLKYPVEEEGCSSVTSPATSFLQPGHRSSGDRIFPGTHIQAWPR